MTQCEQLLKHLRTKSITPMEAFAKFGITCLSERIRDLREKGAHILTTMQTENGKRFARYTLIKEKK